MDVASDTKTSALFPLFRIYHFWILDADVDDSMFEIVEPSVVATFRRVRTWALLRNPGGVGDKKLQANPVKRKHIVYDTNILVVFQIQKCGANDKRRRKFRKVVREEEATKSRYFR